MQADTIHRARLRRFVIQAFLAWLLALALAPAFAQAPKKTLAERLPPEVLAIVFPGAERLGPEGGSPSAAPVFMKGELVGYVYSTLDVVAAPGYSSVPFDVVVGVDLSGAVTGAKVLFHNEPHVLGDAVRQPLLDRFLGSHAGHRLRGPNPNQLPPDFVTGVTVTARAMRDAIEDAGVMVWGSRVEVKRITSPVVDIYGFRPMSVDELLRQGSIAHKRVTSAEIAELFEQQHGPGARPNAPLGAPGEIFVDFQVALATPPIIGRNLLKGDYSRAMQRVPLGAQAIYVKSEGRFDFLEDTYFGQPDDYAFIHVRAVQGDRVFRFTRGRHQKLQTEAADTSLRRVAALFQFEPRGGFDPLKPWRLELLVDGTAPGGQASVRLALDYVLPGAHILLPGQTPEPAWVAAWRQQSGDLGILAAMLVVLTFILVFQQRLSQTRSLHRWVRNGFLGMTLVWLGWIAGGQLSILNVINYVQAPFRSLDVGFYLAEPLIAVIAGYTLLSLVLLGRGVFCGWLCPFGALQELLAQTARALKLPQWNPSEPLQKRLWPAKYASAVVVIGVSFHSFEAAYAAAEVEPFKTAITAGFVRAWPFVVYAVGLLGIGLFTERAFCRFLCPLGGTLAILGHFHVFDMLARRPECGSPCHLCERACPVRAIERTGKINMDECFQCLDCQVEYNDDRRCPPLAKVRKARERAVKPSLSPLAARTRA